MVVPVPCRNAAYRRPLLLAYHTVTITGGRYLKHWDGPLGKGAQAASEDVEPAELECFDGIIDKTLGADIPGVSRDWRSRKKLLS